MAVVDLVIDLGSSFTTIFKSGEGVVLHEPSIVLVNGDILESSKIVSFGNQAKNMSGKIAEGYQLLFPIQEGAITYRKATIAMLTQYVKSVVSRNDYFFKPKIRAFVNVPCGCQSEERTLIEQVFNSVGVMEVYMLESPQFAYFGSGIPLDYKNTSFVVDIGGGLTDIAVIGEDGIISGNSYGIGGLAIDRGIIEGLETSLNIHVGMLTAETIKKEIGSLFENENNSMTVFGKNYSTGMPKNIVVSSKYVRPMIEYYYGKIADIILDILKTMPDNVLENVYKDGIILTGGGAKMQGLEYFFKKRLGATIIIPEKAEFCGIMGGASLLNNPIKLNRLLKIM
ncbi:MAG: rod shape-determining protein [Clostridia bacterium]